MTRYLTAPEVVAINAEVVRKFGGTHAVRDGGLLESAVARPQSGYYADVFEEAAALFESLSALLTSSEREAMPQAVEIEG